MLCIDMALSREAWMKQKKGHALLAALVAQWESGQIGGCGVQNRATQRMYKMWAWTCMRVQGLQTQPKVLLTNALVNTGKGGIKPGQRG